MTSGTRRVSVTPRPLFTPGKDPVPIVEEAPIMHGVKKEITKMYYCAHITFLQNKNYCGLNSVTVVTVLLPTMQAISEHSAPDFRNFQRYFPVDSCLPYSCTKNTR
jgi:hypothetical protein